MSSANSPDEQKPSSTSNLHVSEMDPNPSLVCEICDPASACLGGECPCDVYNRWIARPTLEAANRFTWPTLEAANRFTEGVEKRMAVLHDLTKRLEERRDGLLKANNQLVLENRELKREIELSRVSRKQLKDDVVELAKDLAHRIRLQREAERKLEQLIREVGKPLSGGYVGLDRKDGGFDVVGGKPAASRPATRRPSFNVGNGTFYLGDMCEVKGQSAKIIDIAQDGDCTIEFEDGNCTVEFLECHNSEQPRTETVKWGAVLLPRLHVFGRQGGTRQCFP